VAAAFSIIELAVLCALCLRNRYFDRANALFHLPLVVQEGLQALLWLTIDSATGERECSDNNRLLSWVLTCIVGGFPLWNAGVAHLQRLILFPLPVTATPRLQSCLGRIRRYLGLRGSWTDEWPRARVPVWLDALRCGTLCWGLGIWVAGSVVVVGRNWDWGSPSMGLASDDYSLYAWFHWCFMGPYCTRAGPHGHQIWPFVVFPHWTLKFAACGLYLSIVGSFNLLARPSFAFAAISLLGVPSVLLLYLLVGDEWGSVWCWLASMSCVIYLFEPWLIETHRALDPELLQPTLESDERRRTAGLGFMLAWKHAPQDLLPWADLLRSEAKEAPRHEDDFEVFAGEATRNAFGPPASLSMPKPMEMS